MEIENGLEAARKLDDIVCHAPLLTPTSGGGQPSAGHSREG
jgi:hypothetical protein